MDQKILTTTEAARLLGVSVRTAQLLIEGGSIPSWKTPGGHRRVYHRDVLAIIGRSQQAQVSSSALVFVVTRPQRAEAFQKVLSVIRGATVRCYTDAYLALVAIGARMPGVVVIDVAKGLDNAHGIRDSLLADPGLGHARLVTVGRATGQADRRDAARLHEVADLKGLPEAVRTLLHGSTPDGLLAEIPAGIPVCDHEGQRLVALERSGLVDTPPEDAFDRLTWLAARGLKMPIALITLLTPTRQWFKSHHGLDMGETPRDWSFCNHTILQQHALVVPDLARDARFAKNPAVAGDPGFRFYAGHPIVDQDGFALGSLCVIDTRPRKLTSDDEQMLAALAALASDEIRLRATDRRLRWAMDAAGEAPFESVGPMMQQELGRSRQS